MLSKTFAAALIAILCASCQISSRQIARSTDYPALRTQYLDLITTYISYAPTIWHDDPAGAGGFWGPVGIAEKNQNGAVRGMTDIMLGHALLIHAIDNHWLTDTQRAQLDKAHLDRAALLKYIKANLTHITAHHKSAPKPLEPSWGFSWQSTMWTGNAGPGVLLVWNDLSDDLKNDFKRLAFSEADRIVAKPPKTYLPGDTGAEENGWDSYAPAMALAVDPTNPRAPQWLKALKIYAVNTYSIKADRTSDAMVGTDRVRDLVTTTNLFDDFTLDNHGFFHPDYVQVSAQELGDSLLFLELGDQIHKTHLADEFRPYALHHVKDVWEKVARPLLLPTGEFAFPNGTDWQLNCSMMPAYFAYIAAALHDPVAYNALQRQVLQATRHRALSPPGRVLGDTNMEWFWEPILVRRTTTVLLDFELHTPPAPTPQSSTAIDTEPVQRYFPDSNVWLYRNNNYFVSAGWGKRHMGTFTPFMSSSQNPYLTLPIDGILPAETQSFDSQQSSSPDQLQWVSMKLTDGRRCYLICLPNSVLWLAPVPLRPLAIENDKLSGGKRTLYSTSNPKTVDAMRDATPFDTGPWLNIDDTLGLITAGENFHYTNAKGYNRRSFAFDAIVPTSQWGAWQMIPRVTHDQTQFIAHDFNARLENDSATITLHDGVDGPVYRIRAEFGNKSTGAPIIERQ